MGYGTHVTILHIQLLALMQKHEGEKGERPAASRCTTKVLEAFDDENQWEQLSPPVFLGYADKGSME